MENEIYYVYPNNWWEGFTEKTDANHIGFFSKYSCQKLKLKILK